MEYKDGKHNREPVPRRNQGSCWKSQDLRKEEGEPQRPRGSQPSREIPEVKSRRDFLLHGRRPRKGARPLRRMRRAAPRWLLPQLRRRIPGRSQPRGRSATRQARTLFRVRKVGGSAGSWFLLAFDAAGGEDGPAPEGD